MMDQDGSIRGLIGGTINGSGSVDRDQWIGGSRLMDRDR